MGSTPNQLLRSIGVPAAVAGLALCVMLAWNALGNGRPSASPEYLAGVRDRVHQLPYAIGTMVATDIDVIAAAAEMLKPNVIMQRVYRDPLSGHMVSMVIVHCEDVRDLAGHYPPVCYPNAGWKESAEREVREMVIDEYKVPATTYHFSKKSGLIEDSITITSFFVLPDDSQSFAPNMLAVDKAARSPATAGLGAAHIMLITPDSQPGAESARLVDEVAHALRPVLRSIVERATASGSARPSANQESRR